MDTIREAGALARHYFETGAKSWSKPKGDPITEADLAVDGLIKARIDAARPEDGWLSEESHDDLERLARKRVWIVDPIDGTLAFIKKRPHFTVSIALIEDGAPVLGAVFNPMLSELFEAEAGGGARLNGAPIQTSDRGQLEGCRMLAPRDLFAHPGWAEPWPAMQIENRSSIAYRLSLVAAGQFDAMLALSRKREWDVAAGALILSEAGGCITTHFGKELRYNQPDPFVPSLVGAGPRLHEAIIGKVQQVELR
jgi:myo-inositol-1(or 4)-monophosphatase